MNVAQRMDGRTVEAVMTKALYLLEGAKCSLVRLIISDNEPIPRQKIHHAFAGNPQGPIELWNYILYIAVNFGEFSQNNNQNGLLSTHLLSTLCKSFVCELQYMPTRKNRWYFMHVLHMHTKYHFKKLE
jgi:hypothetical protein